MSRPLEVTVRGAAGQRFACQGCTRCCRELVVHLSASDVEQIDRHVGPVVSIAGLEPVTPYVHLGRARVLNKRSDGACVFLTEAGRCGLHEQFGVRVKPLACRLFPFTLRRVADTRWRAAVRFDCPAVARSAGRPLSAYGDELSGLGKMLAGRVKPEPPLVRLTQRLVAEPSEVRCVVEAMDRCMTARTGLERKLRIAAFVSEMLARATLDKVRGPRLDELVKLLFSGAPEELAAVPVQPAASRARRLFRQLVFAYGTSARLDEMAGGRFARLALVIRQLRDARRFRRGRGLLPGSMCRIVSRSAQSRYASGAVGATPRSGGGTQTRPTFARIETVQPAAGADTEPVSELVTRYVRNRLACGSICGAGYYDWPLCDGLPALWLAVIAAGWFARVAACLADRDRITLDDMIDAVGIVDRAVGRLPALGTATERMRTRYLVAAGGLQRLLTSYPLVESMSVG